ncbi:alpha/beta fold hydrolase [Kribbella sp. VKM Ac-2568]|uniref:alpha/beta fold hydrolase n=1 Tax=Kribbella sp. VKM Ac-2568 TaxID=2512219 RepID=UPI00104D8E39|nr:alpha/beta hydrolase [Kribbella sp. VKM Ac-2568]TCM44920.1 pimeloyl-ACP methyl ester carboxylesterase [Kribbella sp. VKM Ac-2568]
MSIPPSESPSQAGGAEASTRRFSRRGFVGTGAAVAGGSLLGGWMASASAAASPSRSVPDGFGSVSTAPRLPAGFTKTFRSRFVQANGIRQHVVIGGDGPPLLLVHGWPENWYAWRFMMPALARDFTVIAVDQRGIGLTEKTRDGYDAGTLGDDLAALMTELGHQRFAVVGHDTGYIISYALAADHRDRVARLVVAEIPGPPGVVDPLVPPPPLFLPEFLNNKLWHIPFNRVDDELIVDMVKSNADAYYRYEYSIQAGGPTLPDYAIDYYVALYTRDRNTLRASFGVYRAWDATLEQNGMRQETKLTIPVLGIGGENSWGPAAAGGIKPAATDVQTLVIPGVGHWVAEQAPAEMLEALDTFLAPYLKAG